MQPHSIILWAEPKKEAFEDLSVKCYNILNILKNFSPDLSPKYILDFETKKFKEYEFNINEIKKILKDNINKEGDKIFPELGYRIHFISHLNTANTTGISMTIGASFERITNTINIGIKDDFVLYDNHKVNFHLVKLFKNLIELYKPFWGCVSNDINSNRIEKFIKSNKPTTVHWLNFWGSKLLNELKINNWENAPIEEYEQIDDGYFIKLKKEPIDDENENDLLLQQNANRYFDLL